MVRKPTGLIGATKFSPGENGGSIVELVPTPFSESKESVEAYFATIFERLFNEGSPLGASVRIEALTQLDTSDLDFSLKSKVADYLELAEINPRSEEWGREIFLTGKYYTYQIANWIYEEVIMRKGRSYGQIASRVILVLYATNWQFQLDSEALDCISGLCAEKGMPFAAIFFVESVTPEVPQFDRLFTLAPATPARLPSAYSDSWCVNFPPSGEQVEAP